MTTHKEMDMRTRVEIVIVVEVEHTDQMSIEKIEKLASDSLSFRWISGFALDYGGYRTKMISQSAKCKDGAQSEKTEEGVYFSDLTLENAL